MLTPASGSFFSLVTRPLIFPVVPAPASGGITSKASAAKARRYSTDALRDMTRLLSEATRVSDRERGPGSGDRSIERGKELRQVGAWGVRSHLHDAPRVGTCGRQGDALRGRGVAWMPP